MPANTRNILVVFGATGNQGGSVIKSILGDPATAAQYHIRAVTRDPSKPNAAALAGDNVTVVKANLDDKDSLREVMKDAHSVFLVTNFHEKMSKDYEVQQGVNVADVAKELNIQHLIWSGAPYVTKISEGKYTKVDHFDGKGIIEEHIRSIGIPATYLWLGIFMHAVLVLAPVPGTKKSYKLMLPVPAASKWPLLAVNSDAGKYVKAILANREKLLGERVYAAQEEYTISEITAQLKQKGGVDVEFEEISREAFKGGMESKGLPEVFVEDLTQMMEYIHEYGYFGGPGVDAGHKLLTEPLETFDEWMAKSSDVVALK